MTVEAIENILQARDMILNITDGVCEEKMFLIPKGFNNNMYWNLGHVSATLALLTYKLSGLPIPLDEQFILSFGKGSSPSSWADKSKIPTIAELKQILKELPVQIKIDLQEKQFSNFKPYQTSAGINLQNINEALNFVFFHDGLHIGYILAQKRVLFNG